MAGKSQRVRLGEAHMPLREQVRDDIRQQIIRGNLEPGQRIVERDIAAELGVSRIPVREAFRMLESEGLVSVVPRRGVIVARISRRDVEELFDIREALEGFAARRATERASDAELKGLLRIAERGARAAERSDARKATSSQESFHDEIILLTHNELLANMIKPLATRLHWLLHQGDYTRLCQEHRELAEAIASRDPERAAYEALEHVRSNRQRALDLLFGDEVEEAATEPPAGA